MQRKYSRLEDCFFAVLKRFRGKLRIDNQHLSFFAGIEGYFGKLSEFDMLLSGCSVGTASKIV